MTKTKYCQEKLCVNVLKLAVEKESGECDNCWNKKNSPVVYTDDSLDTVGPKCTHKGSPLVFTIGDGFVKAGGDRDIYEWDRTGVDLVVNLTGHTNNVVTWNDQASQLLGRCHLLEGNYAEIIMSWSDMSPPPVHLSFFKSLAAEVYNGTNILIHCMGGHGRTGTALAAIIHAALAYKTARALDCSLIQGDPIIWLRKNYCNKSVETKQQIEWLKEVGVQTSAKASHVPGLGKAHSYLPSGTKISEWVASYNKHNKKKGNKGG